MCFGCQVKINICNIFYMLYLYKYVMVSVLCDCHSKIISVMNSGSQKEINRFSEVYSKSSNLRASMSFVFHGDGTGGVVVVISERLY